jgi:hypothetical protein
LLTIAADVDTAFELPPHDVGQSMIDLGLELRRIDMLAMVATDKHRIEPLRARQAPDVRRYDTVLAPFHELCPSMNPKSRG